MVEAETGTDMLTWISQEMLKLRMYMITQNNGNKKAKRRCKFFGKFFRAISSKNLFFAIFGQKDKVKNIEKNLVTGQKHQSCRESFESRFCICNSCFGRTIFCPSHCLLPHTQKKWQRQKIKNILSERTKNYVVEKVSMFIYMYITLVLHEKFDPYSGEDIINIQYSHSFNHSLIPTDLARY